MRRYLRILTLWFFALAALWTGFTYSVNPYDYWEVPRIENFNAVKPELSRQQAIAKPKQWERLQPEVVILGNSRVQVGFDPHSPVWQGGRAYNAGFPGFDLVAQLRAVERVSDTSSLRKIYVGMDFLDFRISEKDWAKALVSMTAEAPFQTARYYAELLWSNSAFADSIATVFAQFKGGAANVTQEGFNPAGDFKIFVENNGPRALFAIKERDYLKDLSGKSKQIQWPMPGENPQWQAVQALIQWADASGAELIFFTHPYHVSLLEAFDRLSLWPAYETWKTELTMIAEQQNIPLWDFAVISDETTEAVPDQGSMMFYWEASHYKSALGDMMVRQMQGGEGFGVELKSVDIQDHLLQQREQLQDYRSAHPGDARRVHTIQD